MHKEKPSILLFIVLRDKRINSLLNSLRTVFNDKKSNSDIHITVRGPFRSKVKAETIDKLKEIMKYDVILIKGAGYFSNNDEYVVYLKIDSPNLEKIWKKSDYPKYIHGFNPHITLYRGNNEVKAKSIYEFLVDEEVELLCEDFEFKSYDLNQRAIRDDLSADAGFDVLEAVGSVKEGVIARAKRLIGEEDEAE